MGNRGGSANLAAKSFQNLNPVIFCRTPAR